MTIEFERSKALPAWAPTTTSVIGPAVKPTIRPRAPTIPSTVGETGGTWGPSRLSHGSAKTFSGTATYSDGALPPDGPSSHTSPGPNEPSFHPAGTTTVNGAAKGSAIR